MTGRSLSAFDLLSHMVPEALVDLHRDDACDDVGRIRPGPKKKASSVHVLCGGGSVDRQLMARTHRKFRPRSAL